MESSCANDTINSLGFVEVKGLCAAIQTADAMVKCASVRLLRQLSRDPQLITLVVEGELGACSAAVEVGAAQAERLGALVASRVMGRPAQDTGAFVLHLAEAGKRPFGDVVRPAPAQPENPLAARVLKTLGGKPEGLTAAQLAKSLGEKSAALRDVLEALCADGRVQKHGARYVIVDGGAK